MTRPFKLGLVGARGHAGAELLRLAAGHPSLRLAYAGSREFAGRPVADICPSVGGEVLFEALSPEDVAARRADVVILALPDGAGRPFVDVLEAAAPDSVIIDLSADRRFDDRWAYGLPELHRSRIRGARRIANPGCYATAVQLAAAPLVPFLAGPASAFGVSGYSGAGTTPGPRNDAARLKDNLMPYKLVGHNHEREASRHLGCEVWFTPHVHPAFRGIVATLHLPLARSFSAAALKELYRAAYRDEPLVEIQDEPPELADGAGRPGVLIGGFAVADDLSHAVVVAAEDNLLKGAALQAVQNLNLALGLPEFLGVMERATGDGKNG